MSDSLNNGIIAFDPVSGISEAEQMEILAEINRIAEKNRSSFSTGSLALSGGRENKIDAKKKDGLFPAMVNAAAAVFLCGGFLIISALYGKTGQEIRAGSRVYNSAERALIEEIRRESREEVAAKENEIAVIISKLTGVDNELRGLQSTNQELSAEQRATLVRLQRLQEEYMGELSTLQDERSQILEASRAKEAGLRAQLDARTQELTLLSEQSRAALSSARGELERLSGEQEKASAIEAQLGAYFTIANNQIQGELFDEARDTLGLARGFLDTPSFRNLRPVQGRRDYYVAVINSLEGLIGRAQRDRVLIAQGGGETISRLMLEKTQLEANMAELNLTIAALGGDGSALQRRVVETETALADLRTANAAIEARNAELAGTAAASETAVRELTERNNAQAATITNLNSQLDTIRQALQALSQNPQIAPPPEAAE